MRMFLVLALNLTLTGLFSFLAFVEWTQPTDGRPLLFTQLLQIWTFRIVYTLNVAIRILGLIKLSNNDDDKGQLFLMLTSWLTVAAMFLVMFTLVSHRIISVSIVVGALVIIGFEVASLQLLGTRETTYQRSNSALSRS